MGKHKIIDNSKQEIENIDTRGKLFKILIKTEKELCKKAKCYRLKLIPAKKETSTF